MVFDERQRVGMRLFDPLTKLQIALLEAAKTNEEHCADDEEQRRRKQKHQRHTDEMQQVGDRPTEGRRIFGSQREASG